MSGGKSEGLMAKGSSGWGGLCTLVDERVSSGDLEKCFSKELKSFLS